MRGSSDWAKLPSIVDLKIIKSRLKKHKNIRIALISELNFERNLECVTLE